MFIYLLLGIGGILGGLYAARRVTGRRIVVPGTSIGTGASVTPSTKLATASDDARGIDVSSAQGVIDWAKVKAAGIAFAIIKLTEAETGVDAKAAFNMAGCTTNGILKSAYHFAHLLGNARVQAQFFASKIKAMGGIDLPPMLDYENVDSKTMLSPISKAATIQWAKDFIDEMKNQGFPVVWLYSYPSYLLQLMPDFTSSGFGDICQLVIADYGQTVNQSGDVPDGAIPAGFKGGQYAVIGQVFKNWVVWQTHGNDDLPKGTGSPRIPGIGNAVDRDRFNGNLQQLQGSMLARVT